MDRPAPDPLKLAAIWQRWEDGEVLPGKTLSELKTGGMPELLESLAVVVETGSDAPSE